MNIEFKTSNTPETCSRCHDLGQVSYIEIGEKFAALEHGGVTRNACMECWERLRSEVEAIDGMQGRLE